jgi:deoxyribodipyrimidine photolyase
MKTDSSALFWFRCDLRDEDNAGLHAALCSARKVVCAFVFDREILAALPSRADRRYLHAPWTMLPLEQKAAGCEIGRDYPAPVVDHAQQRERALALYKAARTCGSPGTCPTRPSCTAARGRRVTKPVHPGPERYSART